MSNIPITPVLGEDPFNVLEDNRRAVDALRVSMHEAPAAHSRDAVTDRRRSRVRTILASAARILLFGAATAIAASIGAKVGRKRRTKLWYRALRKPSFMKSRWLRG